MARGVSRPDRGWSWVVAAACFFASLVLSGIFRTSGVLFVAFISDFGVTREAASWPMVLCISVLNLMGPVSGLLARKVGGRPVVIAGAVVAAVGMSSCYLTTSLEVITLLFGGVFGIGYGLMNTVLPGILNAYFLELRATANGIANSGSCFGSMLLPLLFESFIQEFGLSGCFLLTGGLVLNIAVAASLLRPPPWRQEDTLLLQKLIDKPVICPKIVIEDVESGMRKTDGESDTSDNPSEESESSLHDTSKNKKTNHQASTKTGNVKELQSSKNTGFESSTSNIQNEGKPKVKISDASSNESQDQNYGTAPLESFANATTTEQCAGSDTGTTNSTVIENNSAKAILEQEKLLENKVLDNSADVTSNQDTTSTVSDLYGCKDMERSSSCSDIIHPFMTVLTCPMFYVTGITNVTFYFLYHMYVVIIMDYALDTGVPDQDTKYILVAFSVADLFGRLCFGWVTDRKIVSRPRYVMGCMILIGLVFYIFPVASTYWSLIAVSSAYGMLLGCTMVIFPILLVDFLGIELHAVSYGCMCFMNGFASFGRPFLIGYFRDSVGSYSSMFYVLGTISVLASLLWLLEGVFQRNKNDSCLKSCPKI